MARQVDGSWMGFAAMAFIVAGLSGVFTTYALPIPMQRGFAREAALDAAFEAARGPDSAAALAALRPRLGDSATAVIEGPGTPEERILRERATVRERFLAEEEATALRLRWLCVMVSLTGALFVAAIVGGMSTRPDRQPGAIGADPP